MPIGSTTYFGKERIFVDRDACIQAFRENIQKLETQEYNVLFFHGIAGIGKSKLQKELQNILDKEYPEIFWTSIDLNTKTNREVGTFLVTLRNKIQEKCKANFYLFDIAHAIYWKKLHPEIPLPQENYPLIKEGGFFSKVIDVLNEFGPARLAWDILKNAPENVKRSLKEQAIDINKLADMEVHELEKLLPGFFAADFTNYLGTDSKAYIFIDTYEALWDGLRNKGSFHEKDEWIRDNLIPNMSGVSWVICGREPLLWDKYDSDWKIYLEQHLVDGLPESYCQEFLEDCGIENKDIRDIIIKVSEGVPYYLNLSVDTYEKISRSRQPAFEDFGKAQPEVFNTFVKYLRSNEIQALTVLSVPNQWDRGLFEVLMKKFCTELPISTFLELIKFSFIKTYTEGKYSIQQLMRKNLQAYQDPVGRENINKFMLEYYSNRLKDIGIKAITSEHEIALTEAFYHAKEALGAEELFEWFISISAPFFRAAFWQLISPFYEEMLQILKAELGSEHSDVAATLNYLGLLYTNMGDYEKALSLYKRALEIAEKVLGPQHPNVANTLNNLAELYYQMGDYEKALSLYKRALDIREKVLGPQHPDVANTLNNLALLYSQLKDYEKALPLCQRALETREKLLGPQHPLTATSLNNLAVLYRQTRKYEEALQLSIQALRIVEKMLGSQHPEVAIILSNRAEIYEAQGKYHEAEQLFNRALEITTKILGLEHPDVVSILDNLVSLYRKTGESEKELIFSTRANEIRNKIIQKEIPFDLQDLNPNTIEIVSEIEELIRTARELIANHKYLEARVLLDNIVKLPEYQKSIEEEFGFLYDFAASSEEDERKLFKKIELVEYQSNLWYVLSDKSTFSLKKEIVIKEEPKKVDETYETKDESTENSSLVESSKETKNKKLDGTPQEKGEILENAVIELFREFFIIAGDYEVKQQELRKQKAGLQFGFDISLKCSLEENMNVKCHIECKNITETITLANVADKLLQTEDSYPNTDHWILICPTAEPANELHQKVSQWNDTRRFPFNIQIWSKNIIEELFGLNPKVYDLFFEPREGEVHPSQWTPEKRIKVFEKWKDKLKPLIRLPTEWDHYMREPYLLCFKGEDQKELDFLYQNHVQMECTDERKNILNKSMEEYVREWLNDNETPLMFLLGEFGDGKSVFTYTLSRKLAKEYYENPSDGWIPVRFTLREYCNTRNSLKFLKERLERFDVNFASWTKVKEKNRILVILDGFDELTKKLDSDSVSKHIKVLKDCCDEFNNMKIIVTSRTHFLEKQRDKERLLQRLPAHRMCYLAPINRKSCLQYLGNSVDTSEEKQKLKNIEKMHDPIGLASKPLFLQMIRQTLRELPENSLNEIILYKTYIKKSLRRKMELLDDDKMEILPEEICSNLIRILETIAIKLQMSNQEFICLAEEFSGQKEKDLAKRLWQISDSGDALCENIEQEKADIEDATARVGIRSLLTKVMTEKDNIKWPVDFCHRSMREYFVARGICSTLTDDVGKARELLGKLLLNPEILYFASEMMKEDSKTYEDKLSQIILENRSKMREKVFVGNVATLLYRLKGELPGEDWSYLNLEGANLSGADLSGKNFFSTNLCNSCLDNVNFEMADFRQCDLTGVRIEETSKALSIALHPSGSKIIAAYEDNIIREWKIDQKFKLEYRNLGKYKKGSIRQLFSYSGSDLCFLMNEEVILYDYSDTDELKQEACFKIKPEYRHIVAKKDGLVLVSEDEQQVRKAFCVDTRHEILCSKEIKDLIACEVLDQQAFVIATINSIKLICKRNYRETVTLEVRELTSLCTFCLNKDEKYLVACGQRNGDVQIWRIDISDEEFQYEPILNSHIHNGIVSSLVFLDETRIISSGLDRKISIQRFEEGSEDIQGTTEKTLYLTVRCKGMKIDGLKGETERKMLEKLILQAEES